MSAAQKMLKFGFIPLFLLLGTSVMAQTTISSSSGGALSAVPKKVIPKKPKPLRTELSVGYRMNTDGWSIFADKGYVRSEETRLSDQFYNLRVFQLEFGEHKDPAQAKMRGAENATGEQTKPFIYGKVNNFYSLKLGYGFRRLFAGKPEPGNVSIHWIGTAGLALGLEKPYYIEAYAPLDNSGGSPPVRQSIKYTEDNRNYFLDPYYIIGGSGFTKGINEIKFVPGLHLKTGLHFDFAANKKTVLAIEAGASAEFYTRKIQLMAREDGKPYFFNLFASLQFGKRW